MYQPVSTKVHDLNKKLADKFFTMERVPCDRPLSEKRIILYEGIVARGQWKTCQFASCYCEETGMTYRVNGKHQSTLFSRMDKIPSGLTAVVEEYSVKTLADVARLYSTFDNRAASRQSGDINSSFAGTVPELVGVRPKIINIVVSGLSYYLWNDTYGSHPAAERAELFLDQTGFALFVDDLIKSNAHRPLHRLSVVGAIFGSFKKSQKACQEFWTSVRDETGTSPDSPDRKLAKFLFESTVRTSGIVKRRVFTQKTVYIKCIHAWNAWRREESTDLKVYEGKPIPAFV